MNKNYSDRKIKHLESEIDHLHNKIKELSHIIIQRNQRIENNENEITEYKAILEGYRQASRKVYRRIDGSI